MAVNKKFPYRLCTTQMKCSVPVHGTVTNTGIDRICTTHAFRFMLRISVCIKILFHIYGKKLTFGRFDIEVMGRDKRIRETDGCRIISTSSRARETVDRTLTRFLSLSLSPIQRWVCMKLPHWLIPGKKRTVREYNTSFKYFNTIITGGLCVLCQREAVVHLYMSYS